MSPREDQRAFLVSMAEEAYKHRVAVRELASTDSVTVSPEDLYERLLAIRGHLDALEETLVKTILSRSQIDTCKAQAQEAQEDAEVDKADSASLGEYASARDRSVALNAATITFRRETRRWESLAAEAAATVRVVQEMHRGVDGYRREVETRVRAISLTTSLER